MGLVAIIISVLSLLVSGVALWFSRFKKGRLKMTRPSMICFLGKNEEDEPKVFMRTLLYIVSERGEYIQNMFLKVRRAETIQNFNIWSYGENKLVRGSGLFVDKVGISTNHHFLLPPDEQWIFKSGNYLLEFYAETAQDKTIKLFECELEVTDEHERELKSNEFSSLFFNWAPNQKMYISHLYNRPLTIEESARLLNN